MTTRDPAVDAYIEKAEPFAQPILRHLREVIHSAAPGIGEAIKWKFPVFEKKGILCHMAAFKAHCAFGFWKPDLVLGPGAADADGMGQFGRITAVDDLPPADQIQEWVRKAVSLNEAGVQSPPKSTAAAKEAPIHPEFREALDRDPEARATFDGFSPSHRREYAEWIAEAKRDATRARRIETALEWLADGKPRNWKYMKGRS